MTSKSIEIIKSDLQSTVDSLDHTDTVADCVIDVLYIAISDLNDIQERIGEA